MYRQVTREAIMNSADNSIIELPHYEIHCLPLHLGSGIFKSQSIPGRMRKERSIHTNEDYLCSKDDENFCPKADSESQCRISNFLWRKGRKIQSKLSVLVSLI